MLLEYSPCSARVYIMFFNVLCNPSIEQFNYVILKITKKYTYKTRARGAVVVQFRLGPMWRPLFRSQS